MTDVFRYALLGFGLGALYTFISQGLIAIYRGSGVLNFAQGAMGMAGAYVYYELRVVHGGSFVVAFVVGVGFSALIGALTQVLVMRHLRRASPLARIVATLGILIALQAIAILRYGSRATAVPSELPTSRTELLGVVISVDRLILIAIAAALTLVLHLVYRHTRFGLTTTAVAENERSAAAVGLSPGFVATANWAIGAGLAGLAAILVAPIITLQPGSMTTLALAAMAVALLANFSSFPLALAGGMALGVAQSELLRYVQTPGLATSLPFFVIVAVVVIGGQALPLRDFFLQRLPSIGSGRVRWPLVVAGVALATLLIAVASPTWNLAITNTLATAVIVLSVVVVTGYCGQISLAQFAFGGFGAWIAGRLVATHGWDLAPAALLGIIGTVPLGAAFALPALRARGVQLAIVTLGLGSAIELMIFNNGSLVGGFAGTMVGEPKLFGVNIAAVSHPERYSLVCLGCLVLIALAVASMRRGRVGRRLIAVRTNERAAAALGISVAEAKVYAFALAAGIAAVGGILLAFQLFVITYGGTFTATSSISVVAWAFIGGIGYLVGPLFGATLAPGSVGAEFSNTILSGLSDYLGLIGGGTVVLLVLGNQNGIAKELIGQLSWLAGRVRRVIPRLPELRPEPVEELPAVAAHRVAPRTIEVEGLTVRYGAVTAVDGLTMSIRPGEVVGLIGPNGAGKTSAIDALSGFSRPAAGSIRLDGVDITALGPTKRARAGISRSFQSLELFEDATVLDNIRAASDPRDRLAYLKDLVAPGTPPLPSEVVAAIREFGLHEDLGRLVSDLPYGRRRIVAIVRALATSPGVLLLDEPAAGLSESETAELARLVRRLAVDWGIAVLLVEHDMSFVMEISDRIVVLDFGRKIADGVPDRIRADEQVIAVYLGEDEDDVAQEIEREVHRA